MVSSTPVQILPGAGILSVGPSTFSLPPFVLPGPASLPKVTINGQVLTPAPSSGYILASKTVFPGSPVTVSGLRVALNTDIAGSSHLVIGTSTTEIVTSLMQLPVIINSMTLIPNVAPAYNIDGSNLMKLGEMTVSGIRVALTTNAAGQDVVVVGSSTRVVGCDITSIPGPEPIEDPTDSEISASPPSPGRPLLEFNGHTFDTDANGAYVIASQTLVPGKSITVENTPILLATSSSELLIGTSIINSTQPTNPSMTNAQSKDPGQQAASVETTSDDPSIQASDTNPLTTSQPTPNELLINGDTIIALSTSGLLIRSQTLTPGETITVSGTAMALDLDASETALVIAGSTITAGGADSTPTSIGLGAFIMSAFDPMRTSTTSLEPLNSTAISSSLSAAAGRGSLSSLLSGSSGTSSSVKGGDTPKASTGALVDGAYYYGFWVLLFV